MNINNYLPYFIIINLLTFILFVYDKYLSKNKKLHLRIPEKTLIFLAAIGGSAGEFFAMKLVRHKTRKPLFYIGIPFIIFLQLILIFFLAK